MDDIHDKGKKVTLEEANSFRENFLKEKFKVRYSDNASLYVEHNEMRIQDFMTKVCDYSYNEKKKVFTTDESVFSMAKLFPVPTELEQPIPTNLSETAKQEISDKRKKKYGVDNSYDWAVANWGTKWDVTDIEFEDYGNYATFTFQTAWSPPVEFLKNICEKYPLLDFYLVYSEAGCAFEGELSINAGEVMLDETREYSQKCCVVCGEDCEEEALNEEGECLHCQEHNNEEENEDEN